MKPPVIALLHGWAMHSGLFDGLKAEWPEPDWRGVDLPGHGTRRGVAWPSDPSNPSNTDPLLDLLTDPLPDGCWLTGWSLGGLLAMQAVLREPDRFAGLVLIAATPSFLRKPDWKHAVEPALLQAMALGLVSDPERVFHRFIELEIQGGVNSKAERSRLREISVQHGLPDPDALKAGLDHLARTDLRDRLEAIDVPVLLVGGRRDRLVPWPALIEVDGRLAHSQRHCIAGAAHAPFLTQPREVADLMKEWITNV